jgi:branched-chain amino acid transport system permease protein
MDYLFYILGLVDVFIILAVSLNLLIGFAGLLSLAHAAFMAVGAYVTTLLMMKLGVNFFATLPAAAVVAAIIGAAVAAPFLRLKGHIYAFGSFAIMMLFYNITLNWVGLTRGPFGLAGIPRPDFFGIEINNFQGLFVVSTVVMLLCTLACWRLSKSAFGSTLKAIRGDEAATAALGKNITYYKVVTFSFCSGVAAIAGSLYAVLTRFIDPFCFTIHDSIFIIAIVVIGGIRNIKGSILGAVILIGLPEILKFFAIPESVAGQLRQMIYGGLLIVFMLFRPQGIIPEYKRR